MSSAADNNGIDTERHPASVPMVNLFMPPGHPERSTDYFFTHCGLLDPGRISVVYPCSIAMHVVVVMYHEIDHAIEETIDTSPTITISSCFVLESM
jgi:hypothetical protein